MAGVGPWVVKVADNAEIASRGVLSTPGLDIDGQIRETRRVHSAGDIAEWLVAD